EVGAREPGGAAGDDLEIDVGAERRLLGVHAQDAVAALHIGPGNDDAAVEAAGAQQRRIEDVGPVGGGDQDHAVVGLEAVHLDQQLVESLLTLVVPAAQAGPAVAADGVDLVDEDDAGGVLLALVEEVTDPAGADAHEHLDEVRARDGEEGDAGLAGDGPRQQRLAGAGGAHHEDALGDAAAQAGELLRVLEEGDDLLDLVLGLLDAGHVGEGDLALVLGQQLGLRLAEAHRLAAAHLELAHEHQEQHHQHDHGKPGDQHLLPEAALVLLDDLVLDAGLVELGVDRVGQVTGGDE